MSGSIHGRRGIIAVTVLLFVGLVTGVAASAQTIYYVDQNAKGSNNGTSWTDAYTDLAYALSTAKGFATAADPIEIWVAAGTYYPEQLQGVTDPRSLIYFPLYDNVALYGGFNGTETALDQRDPATNVTILSGDIGARGDASDNCYHVVSSFDNDGTAVLDGFTIIGGNANGQGTSSEGGGMVITGGSPMITDCTFSANNAAGSNGGGGIYVDAGSTAQIMSCTFASNTAQSVGGAMAICGGSSLTITDCTFTGNTAGSDGGAIVNNSSSPSVTNCTFSGNSAGTLGGAMANSSSSPTVISCTFAGNSASQGMAIGDTGGSSPTVYDSILWGGTGTYEMNYGGTGSPTVTDCVIQGGYAYSYTTITADPLLGTLGSYNDGLSGTTETIPLLPGSSAIGAGDSNATTYDQRGLYRESSPDIGAFQSRGFTLVVTGGDGQTTATGTAFPSSLVVGVNPNGSGEPVDGGVVTFTAPSSGASATLSAQPVTIVGTHAGAAATANGTAGSYTVTADTAGAGSGTGFNLTNAAIGMSVEGNGTAITNGESSPSAANGTDFGGVDTAGGPVSQSFTIKCPSDSTAALTVSGVTINGTNAADFQVTVAPASSVAAGNTTTFTIQFEPSATGMRTATVQIGNNTAQDPYTFEIQGTGTSEAMAVSFNGNAITNGATAAQASATNGTGFGSADIASGTVDHTFTITSAGTAPLNLTGSPKVAISGANAADFTVTAEPTSPVAANGGTTTFTVQFDPSTTGTRNATASIVYDNPEVSPFTFAIQGTGTSAAMDIKGNGTTIANGESSPSAANDTEFGSADIAGGNVDRTFTIDSTGSSSLTLSPVEITGTDAADFTIKTQPASTVAPGNSTSLTIDFNPSATGVRAATVEIGNNTADNPYTFAIQGTGTSETMAVKGNGTTIASGDSSPATADGTDFGSADVMAGTVKHPFTIESTGTAPLSLTGSPKVAISGANASDFAVTVQPSSPVAAGSGTTEFTIEFNPSGAGSRTATVSIAYSADASPYTFAVRGTGSVSTGDVNDDGTINILDVRLCLDIADGVITGTASQRQRADVDGDGQVTLTDVQQLAQYVMLH